MPRSKKYLVAFPYFGGKNSHLSWLLPQLPATKVFVDVFGGSAAVLLNRAPSHVEIYNDANGHVVNFFRVLRDPALTQELLRQLHLTPFSRAEYVWAYDDSTDPVERARKFYVRVRQSMNSKLSDRKFPHGNWQMSGMKGGSKTSAWVNGIEGLGAVAERLRRVQLEHCRWEAILEQYDGVNTLFYLDPPYGELRNETQAVNDAYGIRFGVGEQMRLADAVKTLKGKVAVSGYAGLYEALYEGWRVETAPAKRASSDIHNTLKRNGKPKDVRQEMLWMNYPAEEVGDGAQSDVQPSVG